MTGRTPQAWLRAGWNLQLQRGAWSDGCPVASLAPQAPSWLHVHFIPGGSRAWGVTMGPVGWGLPGGHGLTPHPALGQGQRRAAPADRVPKVWGV